MTGLSNWELASMRSTLSELMPDTCNILSGTATPDGIGGQSVAWGTTYSGVSCRLDQMKKGYETMSGGAVYPFGQYVLTIAYDGTINTQNRVEHGSVTYNVIGVDQDKSWPITTRVIVEAIP